MLFVQNADELLNLRVGGSRRGDDELPERRPKCLRGLDFSFNLAQAQLCCPGPERFDFALNSAEVPALAWSCEDINAGLLLAGSTVFLNGRAIPFTLPERMAKIFKILPVPRRR